MSGSVANKHASSVHTEELVEEGDLGLHFSFEKNALELAEHAHDFDSFEGGVKPSWLT